MLQTSNDQQAIYLKESLTVVNVQFKLMRHCLDKNKLMDGVKHCSNMLSELRTSVLSPKNYYELYISTFDSMRYMTSYLIETHKEGQHDLTDLYEVVQYANHILPRLYLMTTVGSIYLSFKDTPSIDVMNDMMEMVKGVQHPIRGLFLRHYLGGMTRDFLPNNGESLDGTIQFIINNFAEMNKLWVRLQYLGHTKDKPKRELERKELGTLVGTNLVRLSQLEGIDINIYQRDILPNILNQVINCNDVMAQEYLMEVIIQIFPDEFHIHTLKPFLATTAQLHSKVNIKSIIMSLLDSLTDYIKQDHIHLSDQSLFLLFWNEIMELVKTRQDFPIQEQTSLFLSLAHFSISCYPDRLDYLDQILLFTQHIMSQIHTKQSESNLQDLLLLPIQTWDILTFVIDLQHYQPLLALQSYPIRRTVALSILDQILENERKIDRPEQVYQLLEICHVLVKDNQYVQQSLYLDQAEDDRDEQSWVARLVHLFYSEDEDVQFLLLSAARQQLENGEPERIKAIFPSLIISSLKLSKRYFRKKPIRLYTIKTKEEDEIKQEKIEESQKESLDWEKKMTTLYNFIHQIIMILYRSETSDSSAVQFALMAGQNADCCGFKKAAYNFYLDAFRIYEESVCHSKAQFEAIVYSIGSFLTSDLGSPFDHQVRTKITIYSTKLLKKPDQSRAIYLSSHVWPGTRLLECLQKSLKIADNCMDTMTNSLLFIELLNQYIYYFDQNNPLITANYINGLIELIESRLKYLNQYDEHPITSNSSSLLEHDKEELTDYITRQYKETIEHLKDYKQTRLDRNQNYSNIQS